jgi:hypothetical protein
VQLLRTRLSSAVVELDHKLQELPVLDPGLRLGPVEGFSKRVNSHREIGKTSMRANSVEQDAKTQF